MRAALAGMLCPMIRYVQRDMDSHGQTRIAPERRTTASDQPPNLVGQPGRGHSAPPWYLSEPSEVEALIAYCSETTRDYEPNDTRGRIARSMRGDLSRSRRGCNAARRAHQR